MDGVKSFLTSKTVWGGIIAFLGAIGTIFHVNFGADDQAAALNAIYGIMDALGALIAIYGRVVATKKIG